MYKEETLNLDGHSVWQRNWLWHPHFLFQRLEDPHHIFLAKLIYLFESVSHPTGEAVQHDRPLLLINLMEAWQENENRSVKQTVPAAPCVFWKRPSTRLLFVWPNGEHSCIKPPDIFILGKIKHSPLFQMTLLGTDTLLCLIKLINCLMDHKSAGALMGPGGLCWFKYFHITMSKVYGTNPALISTTSQRATYPAATCVTSREFHTTVFITNFMSILKICWDIHHVTIDKRGRI